jgi:hypothetical protein
VITFALYPLLFAIGGARLGWALTLLAFVILVYLSVVSFPEHEGVPAAHGADGAPLQRRQGAGQ